jgi:hypothetical protein
MTVLPPFLTPRIVVPCQLSKVFSFGIEVGGAFEPCNQGLVDQRLEPPVRIGDVNRIAAVGE